MTPNLLVLRTWETLKEFYQVVSDEAEGVPGAVVAIQTFGDFLGFNPHCHVLVTDGCFYDKGTFKAASSFQAKELEAVFRANVFKLLLKTGKINEGFVSMLMSWRHSGCNVPCGRRIWPDDETAMDHASAMFTSPYIPVASCRVFRIFWYMRIP